MNRTTHFDQLLAVPGRRQLVQQELTILDATERIHHLMKAHGISRATLAQRLGKSKSHVTQLLDGKRNMTLRTLSDIHFALGKAVVFRAQAIDDPPGSVLSLDITDQMQDSMRTSYAGRVSWPKPALRMAS
jgi:transcriptional regulator with XRE-family HTH domain